MNLVEWQALESSIMQVRPYTCRVPARQLRGPAGVIGLIAGRRKRPQFSGGLAQGESRQSGPLSRRETPPALFAVNGALQVQALNIEPWTDRAKALQLENATAEQLSRAVRELAPLNPVPPDAEAWVTLNHYHTGLQSHIPVSDWLVIAPLKAGLPLRRTGRATPVCLGRDRSRLAGDRGTRFSARRGAALVRQRGRAL